MLIQLHPVHIISLQTNQLRSGRTIPAAPDFTIDFATDFLCKIVTEILQQKILQKKVLTNAFVSPIMQP